jgi:hypothetical protein
MEEDDASVDKVQLGFCNSLVVYNLLYKSIRLVVSVIVTEYRIERKQKRGESEESWVVQC